MSTASSSVGIGITGGGRLGVGALGTTGTSVSELAKRYAEPKKEPVIRSFLAVFFITCLVSIFAGFVAFYIGTTIAFAGAVGLYLQNRNEFPQKHALWESKFMCLRCQNVFIPTELK